MEKPTFQGKARDPEMEIRELCEQVSKLGKDYTDSSFSFTIAKFYLDKLLNNDAVVDYILEHERRFFNEILSRRLIEIPSHYLDQDQ